MLRSRGFPHCPALMDASRLRHFTKWTKIAPRSMVVIRHDSGAGFSAANVRQYYSLMTTMHSKKMMHFLSKVDIISILHFLHV
jgi:hypothetical protein